jgi:hypothetical protein
MRMDVGWRHLLQYAAPVCRRYRIDVYCMMYAISTSELRGSDDGARAQSADKRNSYEPLESRIFYVLQELEDESIQKL